ncbi:MAG: hypothetical protein ACK56F_20315, partial [bacterium]
MGTGNSQAEGLTSNDGHGSDIGEIELEGGDVEGNELEADLEVEDLQEIEVEVSGDLGVGVDREGALFVVAVDT